MRTRDIAFFAINTSSHIASNVLVLVFASWFWPIYLAVALEVIIFVTSFRSELRELIEMSVWKRKYLKLFVEVKDSWQYIQPFLSVLYLIVLIFRPDWIVEIFVMFTFFIFETFDELGKVAARVITPVQ